MTSPPYTLIPEPTSRENSHKSHKKAAAENLKKKVILKNNNNRAKQACVSFAKTIRLYFQLPTCTERGNGIEALC